MGRQRGQHHADGFVDEVLGRRFPLFELVHGFGGP